MATEMAAVRKAFSAKMPATTEGKSGIGRPSQPVRANTSTVPGTAAISPTSTIRTATGQRSIGSRLPNQAARSVIWTQFRTPSPAK